jgi:hypothetical protein
VRGEESIPAAALSGADQYRSIEHAFLLISHDLPTLASDRTRFSRTQRQSGNR